MTHAELTTLLEFHYWARDRMLESVGRLRPDLYVKPLGSSFGSVRDTSVHIYAADWVWSQRWLGSSPTTMLRVEDFPDVPALARAWRELEDGVRALVAGLDDQSITRVHEYRLLSGKPGRSVFWHMLQHVVNHGSYHRGQVSTMLRQLGAVPPRSTDLIAFYRERSA